MYDFGKEVVFTVRIADKEAITVTIGMVRMDVVVVRIVLIRPNKVRNHVYAIEEMLQVVNDQSMYIGITY